MLNCDVNGIRNSSEKLSSKKSSDILRKKCTDQNVKLSKPSWEKQNKWHISQKTPLSQHHRFFQCSQEADLMKDGNRCSAVLENSKSFSHKLSQDQQACARDVRVILIRKVIDKNKIKSGQCWKFPTMKMTVRTERRLKRIIISSMILPPPCFAVNNIKP